MKRTRGIIWLLGVQNSDSHTMGYRVLLYLI